MTWQEMIEIMLIDDKFKDRINFPKVGPFYYYKDAIIAPEV